MSEDEKDKAAAKMLSFRSKNVLIEYEKHLTGEVVDEKKRDELITYMVDKNLNSNMIQFIQGR